MQFVSLKDSPLVDYIEFFRSKFPLAFKHQPDDNEDEPAQWISAAHQKDFNAFETLMAKVAKERNSLGLLQALIAYKKYIIELPITTKKSECTIQRFYLYLLPVVQIALQSNAQ